MHLIIADYYVLAIIPAGGIWLIISTTHQCLSLSHILTGGVIIDLFPVTMFSFRKPSYSKCECSTLQIENRLIILSTLISRF